MFSEQHVQQHQQRYHDSTLHLAGVVHEACAILRVLTSQGYRVRSVLASEKHLQHLEETQQKERQRQKQDPALSSSSKKLGAPNALFGDGHSEASLNSDDSNDLAHSLSKLNPNPNQTPNANANGNTAAGFENGYGYGDGAEKVASNVADIVAAGGVEVILEILAHFEVHRTHIPFNLA